MAKRQARTLLEVCVARGGVVKGLRVATFVVQWSIAQSALGPGMTVEDAAEWWREAERTWYRRLKDFRGVFDHPDPTPIATELLAAAPELRSAGADIESASDQLAAGLAALGRVAVPV